MVKSANGVSRVKRRGRLILGLCCLVLASGAQGYNDEIHQQLTFMAARQFNRCVEGTPVPMLKPLDVRYIVKANLREQNLNFFARMGRWHFYDEEQRERRVVWFIETRLHERFNDKVAELDAAEDPTVQYAALGSLLNFIQGMTSPAQVVPIYHPRWWRWGASDKFNHFDVDPDGVQKLLDTSCSSLFAMSEKDFQEVLVDTAHATLAAVRSKIPGMNATWEVFWEEDPDYGDFGQYGEVGNSFGREVEFDCGEEQCQLLEGDPIYRAFADHQHYQAVLSTMKAMLVLQRRHMPGEADSR
jgi:hypothetical protein